MKIYTIYSVIIMFMLAITGCLEEDHFGYSSSTLITEFKVLHQVGEASIDIENKTIEVELLGSVFLSDATIKEISFSSFAQSETTVGSILDLNSPAFIQVTAEDESESTWTIIGIISASHPQVRNSSFNNWFKTSSGYFEPEVNEIIFSTSPLWSSNNRASHSIGVVPVIPFELQNNDYAAHLQTLDNGAASALHGRISPGKIFTGTFNKRDHNPSQPASGIDAGIEFTGRPESFKFNYQYVPGEENKNVNGDALDFGDAAEVYMLLEVREGNSIKRLATGWFQTQEPTSSLTEIEIDLKYGTFDNSFPDYLFPENGEFISKDSAEFVLPTHLIFMATSSLAGDNQEGAVGSVLILDEMSLKY